MSKTIKISNSTPRYIETKYRMPGGLPLTITIQPRALLNEVNFHTEEHYLEWKRQNSVFFEQNILIENEKNDKLLEAKGKEYAEDVTSKVHNKVNANVENMEAAADNVNASIKVETENLNQKKKKR